MTIDTTTYIGPDRKIVLQLPAEIEPGNHHIVLMIEEPTARGTEADPWESWRVHDVGPWPEALDLRRESLYGDEGR